MWEWGTYIISLILLPVIMTMVSKTEYTNYFMYTIGPATLIYLGYEMMKMNDSDRKKMIAGLVFIFFSIIFWAFFEQSGGSLSLFAAYNLDNTVLGLTLDPNGVNNSANSLFVIMFAALVGIIWIFYTTRFFADANGVTSLDLFTFGWLVITFGELCLSPIGMSIMTKLAPQRLQAIMMGMWFLASAYGQYFAGILGANISDAAENADNLTKLNTYADGYYQLAVYALIAGVVLIVISPFVKKLMQEVK